MKLTILDRASLLKILPKENDYISFMTVKKIQEKINITDEEWKECKLEQENGFSKWDNSIIMKEIDFDERELSIIIPVIRSLNDQKKISQETVSLYEKFVVS